jgi:integrase
MKIRAELDTSFGLNTDVFRNVGDKILLSDYIEKHSEKYSAKKTGASFLCAQKHIIKCFGKQVKLSQINKVFCTKFKEYLVNNILRASSMYFSKFKQILYKAIDDQLISDMPFLKRMSIKTSISTREYLTESELNLVFNVKFKRQDVKNAFLLSCYTGLRYIDISNLKYTDIEGERLRIRQQKTRKDFSIKLHPIVLDILENQKLQQSNKVFPKLTYSVWKSNVKKLCQQAGITKKITGHCARHTFGTRAYKATKDIYVVSKLLDHKNVATTQIYAKLVDEDKDQAIDKLATMIEIK